MFSTEISKQNYFNEPLEVSGYFRHFGLRHDPFAKDDKGISFYFLPHWEQNVDLILHYLRHENVLLVLTGPRGVGKTTLINFFLLEAIHGFAPTETAAQSNLRPGEFLVQVSDTTLSCQVIADNAFDCEQLLEVIANAFDTATEGLVGSFEEQAEILLNNLQHCKQHCVLLVDQAEKLPDATLSLLIYMINQQSDAQHKLHVILIGDSELKKPLTKLCKAKNYQNLLHTIELGALNLAQTEYYLKHRLAAAGLQDEVPFTSGSIQKIYKLSGGIPKIINQLARELLLKTLKKSSFSSINGIFKPYKKTLVGGSFLLTSFMLILLYLGQETKTNSTASQTTYQPVVVESKPIPFSDTKPSVPTNPEPISSPAMSVPSQSVPSTSASSPAIPPAPTPALTTAVPPSGTAETIEPLSSASQTQQASNPLPANTTLPPDTQKPLPSQPATTPSPQSSLTETSTLIEPNSIQTTESYPVRAPFLLRNKSSAAQRTEQTSIESIDRNLTNIMENAAKTSTKVPKKSKKTLQAPSHGRSIMKLNPQHYTLKITNVSDPSAAMALAAKYKLGKNFMYYKAAGQNTYTLIYGEYADVGTAKRASLLLPKALRRFDVQPYQISTLQKPL
jgi:MSHA biogenesis protein MshM